MILDDSLLAGNHKLASHEIKLRTVIEAVTSFFYDIDILDELEFKVSFVLSLAEKRELFCGF